MTDPILFTLVALGLVAAGLGAALVALWRVHARLRGGLGRIVQSLPGHETAEDDGLSDLERLDRAVGRMIARIASQKNEFESLFELANLGTWEVRADGSSLQGSQYMRRLLGFDTEEATVPLDSLIEKIVPEDRAALESALDFVLTQRLETELEFRVFDADGATRVLRAKTDPGGVVPSGPDHGVSGIVQDITNLRETEAKLEKSSTLERLAGEAARIGGWRYECESRSVTHTPSMSKVLGIKTGQRLPIEVIFDSLHPGENRARIERSFWTCVGTGTSFDEIAMFRTLHNDRSWMRVIGEAERDSSGRIIAAYGATQDVTELIEARSAAEGVRALLQTILDDLSDGFVIHDREGNIQYINRRAHSILGVPDRNLMGGNIWRDLKFESDSPFRRMIEDALEANESRQLEGEIAVSDQWVNVMANPTDAGIALYLNDVTADRDVHARLRLLDAAMRRVNDVVLISEVSRDEGPRVVFVNEAFVGMTGYSQDDILGATPRILQGMDTEDESVEAIREALNADKPLRTEVTNYRKDGSRFTAEIDINPLFDAEGTCTHYVSVQRDITARRHSEELLRASEERLRLASRASNDIIWDWDIRSGMIWNSENADEVFGAIAGPYPPDTLRAGFNADSHVLPIPEQRIENMLERIHPNDRLKITEGLDAALSGKAQTWRCEYRVRSKSGSWRNVADKAFIVRDEQGTPRRMVGAMTDMTEMRALDARLHQAQKLETVGQLTGGIAHDFNNLITIILGNCDIMLEDLGEDAELRPMLQSIEEAAERAAQVASDLLAFARRQPLDLQPTEINDLLQRSWNLFNRAVDASVDLHYDLTSERTIALVDSSKLQMALLNLILNAFAAIETTGRITVTTRIETIGKSFADQDLAPGDYVEIDVTDTGSGMPPEVSRHAFEPFFTTKEPGTGTGLGLSSVYGFIKQCGGHARIQSEPGKGTTVTLSLPLSTGIAALQPADVARDTDGRGGERILIVEDDTELRKLVCSTLAQMGFLIVEAENGRAALDILQQDDAFDLLFTDLVMPGGVSGLQLAKEARALRQDLPILFTSGYAPEALPKRGKVPGDAPILTKPYRMKDLVRCVRETLTKEAPRGA